MFSYEVRLEEGSGSRFRFRVKVQFQSSGSRFRLVSLEGFTFEVKVEC